MVNIFETVTPKYRDATGYPQNIGGLKDVGESMGGKQVSLKQGGEEHSLLEHAMRGIFRTDDGDKPVVV